MEDDLSSPPRKKTKSELIKELKEKRNSFHLKALSTGMKIIKEKKKKRRWKASTIKFFTSLTKEAAQLDQGIEQFHLETFRTLKWPWKIEDLKMGEDQDELLPDQEESESSQVKSMLHNNIDLLDSRYDIRPLEAKKKGLPTFLMNDYDEKISSSFNVSKSYPILPKDFRQLLYTEFKSILENFVKKTWLKMLEQKFEQEVEKKRQAKEQQAEEKEIKERAGEKEQQEEQILSEEEEEEEVNLEEQAKRHTRDDFSIEDIEAISSSGEEEEMVILNPPNLNETNRNSGEMREEEEYFQNILSNQTEEVIPTSLRELKKFVQDKIKQYPNKDLNENFLDWSSQLLFDFLLKLIYQVLYLRLYSNRGFRRYLLLEKEKLAGSHESVFFSAQLIGTPKEVIENSKKDVKKKISSTSSSILKKYLNSNNQKQ